MDLDKLILISVAAIAVIGLMVYFVIKSREKFVALRSNTLNSQENSTGNAKYDRLSDLPAKEVSPIKVTKKQMHLPNPTFGPGFYGDALHWVEDPISGIPVQLFTTPRVQISDFQSEVNRCKSCEKVPCE